MYHSIIYEDVLDCLNITNDPLFAEFASKMACGLELLTGPDDRIALFNDAAHGIALPPGVLREYAASLPVKGKRGDLTAMASGFVRLERGDWTLIVKCGEIGPRYQPGHAHADSLTFELWRGKDKIITDTGTDRYVVDDERKRQRGILAHNTVAVDGMNSSEVWAGHRVARMARTRVISCERGKVEAECVYPSGIVHRRELRLSDTGLSGHDTVDHVCDEANVTIRFHFAPGAERGSTLSSGRELSWEECAIAEEFGKMVKSQCASIVCLANGKTRECAWKIG